MDSFLQIKEGVTKGDPLSMDTYDIGILPLTKQPKVTYPDVTQPCYADDAGELGTYENIKLYFNFLKKCGPGCEYQPKSSKSISDCAPG